MPLDFKGLLSDPMFIAGASILAANQGRNAGGAIGAGLLAAQEQIQRAQEQEAINEYRKQQSIYQQGLLAQQQQNAERARMEQERERMNQSAMADVMQQYAMGQIDLETAQQYMGMINPDFAMKLLAPQRPQVAVNVGGAAPEPPMWEKMQLKAMEAEHDLLRESAKGANEERRKAEQLQNLLARTQTGAWEPMKMRAAAILGVSPDQVANQQTFNALAGDFVMANIQDTKGAVSDAEMRYFAEISPGLEKTEFANYSLLEIQRRQAIRNSEKPKYYRRWLSMNPGGSPEDFDAWYMANHDPWKGEFDIEKLRMDFIAKKRGGKSSGVNDAESKARASGWIE